MALDLGGNKKKQNAKSKYSIVELSLFKPGKKKYAEFDYEEIRKKQLNEDDSSGDDERFHDREALEIVKRLEAKYGGKKDKKGRKLCFGTEDDYMDKRAGYDLDDDFIDDSEAYDELIPSTMDTVQGGFYVNRGKLEFKTKHEEINDSDISDSDDTPQPKKGTKRSQTLSEDEVEVDEDVVPPVAGSANDDKTVSDTPVSIPTNLKPRMVGAPPSKVRRIALGESANQRAANAIKKRLVGMPPTILKRKVLQKLTPRKENEVPGFPRTISGEAIVPKNNDKVETGTASLSLTNKSPEKPAVDVLASTGTCNSTRSPQNAPESATSDASSSNAGIASSPKKRPLAPMTDTLSNMIAEFKRCTNNLALPGQKKRLQNIHVDMVIAIEEQCLKDGYSVHEKARVAHSLADYCGIQKNSLYARCIKRRDEHKNGAPNLAFLPKSPVDGKGISTISTSSSTKAINISLESSLTTKTAGTTTPMVAANKSTISANPVAVSPSPARSNSSTPLPSTSSSSSPASSIVKTSTAPVTSSTPTNTASNPEPSTSVKASQSWTGQKKLAAQAMVTNVAALLPSTERLEDLQEVLRKVGNETMTYDDFLKWHDKSMKSVYARASVEKKNAVNGIARVSPTTSNVNKTTKCGSGASSELAVGTQSKNPTTVPSSLTKRVSLAQAVATAKIPPRGRPLALTHVQISERLESDKQTTLQAIATAIDNSKVAYKKKCDVASATGKPAPRFDFLWTENLANALKAQLDLYWSVLLGSDSYAKLADSIFTVFAKEIFPYFRNEIKLSRLLIEYTRRNPEKAFILACPSAQKLLKDDNVDLSSITVLAKKGKPVNDSVAAKTNPTTPYKPILPVRSSSSDEIQTTSSQDDPDVVVIEPSTSNATTSNDGAATASTPSSFDAMSQVSAALSQTGWTLLPAQLPELSSAMHNLTSITTDPHKLQALKEALLTQFASQYQLMSKKKQGAGKKKDGDDKKKTMEQEKEERKRVKDERREELNAQKRVLAASAKEKAIEEKRLRLEEEKRQKLAEKARKEKEEREKRLEEQAERERLMREEREKLAKEAAEKQKKEEEERQRLEQTRIKIEQERAQELEKRRQAELREEERKAAQLLEQEIRMEEVSQSDVAPDLMLAFKEEEQAESKRLKKQEEQVAAVRAANLAAQTQRMHSTPASNTTTTTVSHNISMNATAEKKPQPMVTPKQQNTTSVGYSVSQQSNLVRSPVPSVIHSSPQYANSSGYGLPSSHGGSCGTTMSPQYMMSMTPPQRSPVVHQQQVVQSPQQYQPVQSPLSSGQQNTAVNRNPSVQAVQYSQPSSQHLSPTAFNQKGPSFMQSQSHESSHQNSYGFGMQQYQRQQQLHHQQQQQHQNQQQQHQRLQQQQQQQQQREQQSHMQNQPVHRQPHVQQSISLNQSMRQPPQSTLPHRSMTEHSMQVQRQSQQSQQHRQSLQHQQIQLEQQQQSACVPGQYQNQTCQQQLTEQQRLMLQQQRVREMYMLQHQHQQLALQRQQQQQQQQQFTMQNQDHRTFPMLQQQSAYQNDARHHEVQQQHMNQYAHHQPQDRDLFRY